MFVTILITLQILMILTVIFVERRRPTEAMLWVLVLICLPYIGAVLYMIFGSTIRIKSVAFFRNKRLQKRYPDNFSFDPKSMYADHVSEEDFQVMHFNAMYNQSQITSYQNADFFIDGASHYQSLFHDIQNAKDCIFVEFFTIHHDIIGKAFVEALTKKAKEGVSVYVMLDFIANLSTPHKMFKPLLAANGKVSA